MMKMMETITNNNPKIIYFDCNYINNKKTQLQYLKKEYILFIK
jgi:hypothetical protein